MSQLNAKVINIWGGPGAGKSTVAAGLFNIMKRLGLKVELVSEVAKDFTHEKNLMGLTNQLLVLGLQDHRLRVLAESADYIITDSPLPTGLAYMTPEYEGFVPEAALGAYHRYDNWDFFLHRSPGATYEAWGRNQTEHEALALDLELKLVFEKVTGYEDHEDGEPPAETPDDIQEFVVPANHKTPYLIAELLGLDLEPLLEEMMGEADDAA